MLDNVNKADIHWQSLLFRRSHERLSRQANQNLYKDAERY